MKLSIDDRMKISEILQAQAGNRATLKLIRVAMEEMSLSDAEIKTSGYVQVPLPNGMVGANWKSDIEKEVTFGETVFGLIKDHLVRLDSLKQLKQEQVSIYDKFVEEAK